MPLTKEENELLCQVGPRTLMGNLLRRYWTPACLSSELPKPRTNLRVRLLGEDLVAFRDADGQVGLIDEHCPHRGASMYYSRNEVDCGLRCVYHGWKFNRSGQCIDMPSEARSFAASIKTTAYPTHESGGIVWTYMGPAETITPFRDFGSETLPEDEVHASKIQTYCNWIQTLDGNIDTVHASFLHLFNAGVREEPWDDTDRPGYPSIREATRLKYLGETPRLEIHDDWYGFRYAGLRTTPNGHTYARISTYILPYATQIANIPFTTRQLLTVPIDDTHTWRYTYVTQSPRFENPGGVSDGSFMSVPGNPYGKYRGGGDGVQQRLFTAENEYGIDRDVQNDPGPEGLFSGIPDHGSQDYMVTETMGPIYDRTREHLGTTDLAIVHFHSLLLSLAQAVAEGKEPPAVGADHDYRGIRAAEKILAADEDWTILGTNDDPIVIESLAEQGTVLTD